MDNKSRAVHRANVNDRRGHKDIRLRRLRLSKTNPKAKDWWDAQSTFVFPGFGGVPDQPKQKDGYPSDRNHRQGRPELSKWETGYVQKSWVSISLAKKRRWMKLPCSDDESRDTEATILFHYLRDMVNRAEGSLEPAVVVGYRDQAAKDRPPFWVLHQLSTDCGSFQVKPLDPLDPEDPESLSWYGARRKGMPSSRCRRIDAQSGKGNIQMLCFSFSGFSQQEVVKPKVRPLRHKRHRVVFEA